MGGAWFVRMEAMARVVGTAGGRGRVVVIRRKEVVVGVRGCDDGGHVWGWD